MGERDIVLSVLEGLDEDLLDYLLPLILARDFESVSPFLLSMGLADDDEQADGLCQKLKGALDSAGAPAVGDGAATEADEDGGTPALLSAPVSLGGSNAGNIHKHSL